MKNLLDRFPRVQEIVPVFAVIVFMVYAWSIISFLWVLPSWLNFMTPAEIASGFCYVLTLCLVESLSFLLFLLALCFILPSTILKNEFVVRGSALTVSVLGSLMLYFRSHPFFAQLNNSLYSFLLAALFAAILAAFLSTAIRGLRRFMNWISDRLIVFLYVLLPLTFLSIIVIVIRNMV